MAKRKHLKQDLNNIAALIIEDCYNYQIDNPGKADGKVEEIVAKTVSLYDEAIEKVSDYLSIDPKARKKYFSDVKSKFEDEASELFIQTQALYS